MDPTGITGLILALSGRLNSLETQKTYINQQLLQRPDLKNFSEFQSIWNRQLTELSTSVDKLTANVKTLQQLYVNLNMNVSSNYSAFTGHTGYPGLHNVV